MLKLRVYLVAWLLRDLPIPDVDACRAWSVTGGAEARGDGWRFDQFMHGLRVAQPCAQHVSTFRHLVPAGGVDGFPPLWQAIINEGLPGLDGLDLGGNDG